MKKNNLILTYMHIVNNKKQAKIIINTIIYRRYLPTYLYQK